jgi:hypothetical protein
MREQIGKLMLSMPPLEICQDHLQVTAEFPQDLPTGAAWGRELICVGHHCHTSERAIPFGKRLEHRHTFGANRQTIGRVFDVATRDDGTVGALECGADLEVRKRRNGVFPDRSGGCNQGILGIKAL